MSGPELDSKFVKRGYWVNLEYGSIMGQTFTTDSRTGGIIVALLAVITSLGMTHLWHLLTFAYYQYRANGRPADGLFRHQQAELRTLPAPGTLVADSVKLWMAWRGVSDRALTRSLTMMVTALFFSAGSLVVSIFSSAVVSNSNVEVLVDSPHCGALVLNSTPSWDSYATVINPTAQSYMANCYREGSLPNECNTFSRPRVQFTTTTNVECPFKGNLCAAPAVSFDSGLLDLNEAFGTNYPKEDRIKYRRKATCAVLSLDGWTEIGNASINLGRDPYPNEEFMYYKWGTYNLKGNRPGQSLLGANITMRLSRT